MKVSKRVLKYKNSILYIVPIFFLYTINVNAYIDPSVMTYAIQAISGIVIALSTVIGLLFRRIKRKLNLGRSDKEYYESDEGLFDNSEDIKEIITKNKEVKGMNENLLSFIVIFFAISSLLLGTIQLYSSNITELYFSLSDVIKPILILCIAFIVIAFLISLLFKGEIKRVIQLLVFGVGLALFIQGNFVSTNYGTLNGEEIIWSNYKFTAIWNTLMWILLIIIPVILYKLFPEYINKIIVSVVSVVLVIQSVSSIVSIINSRNVKKYNEHTFSMTVKEEFVLSSKDNILVFVLDCYDTKEFMPYLNSNKELAKTTLKDFTYYPDTVGGSTRTILAMPHIFTGNPYITETSYAKYITNAYENTDLYEVLNDNNYDVSAYTDSTYLSEAVAKDFINYSSSEKEVTSSKVLAKKWLKFVSFKFLPHVLKKYAWIYSGEFDEAAISENDDATRVIDDVKYYERLMNKGIEVKEQEGSFKLYHLMGNHPPYNMTADIQRVSLSSTEEQQTGVWKILDQYFAFMKEKGVYDNANIIILADHGSIEYDQNPILFVKNSSESHEEMITSDLPVSYNNLQETFKQMVNKEYDSEEKAIQELDNTDNKERIFYKQYDKVVREFIVSGKAYEEEAIKATGNEYSAYSVDEDNKYKLGDKIRFSMVGNGANYMIDGFRTTVEMADYTWSLDYETKLSIPLEETPEKDLIAHFTFGNSMTDIQRTNITINGEDVGTYPIYYDEQLLTIKIPKKLIKDNIIDITFKWLDAVTPNEVNPNNNDKTILAVGFSSLVIDNEDNMDYALTKQVEE